MTETTDRAAGDGEAGSADLVLCDVREGVATLTFNRPEQLNAITTPMAERYHELLDACEADPAVRVIVLTGAGRGFCAGADIDEARALAEAPVSGSERAGHRATHALSLGTPVIAAVNGVCAGLGFVHAMACDLRFAAADATLTADFARRGQVAEYASSWLLPRLVGTATALDLLFSARELTGEEAYAFGFVQQVLPTDRVVAGAQEYAAQLAATCSPASIAVIKRQVYGDLGRDLDSAERRSIDLMHRSFGTPDMREGIAMFLEKRKPTFAPYTGDQLLGPDGE